MLSFDASTEDTVPCRVQYQRRKPTDRIWAIINILTYVAFLSTGFIVVGTSKPRHQILSDSTRGLSEYYMEDAQSCCDTTGYAGYVCVIYENTLYNGNTGDDTGSGGGRRHLTTAGSSKFDGDEGIFDAFVEAPGIVVGLLSIVLVISAVWVLLLRFYTKPTVIFVEVAKIGLMIAMGALQQDIGSRVFCFILALLMVGYVIWQWKTIIFAAEMITIATRSMKENPSILLGSIAIKLLYACNAALFLLFYSKSFNVVNIAIFNEETQPYCDFDYPPHLKRVSIFWTLSYLWTILLFNKMRLSIIATIIGSWRFHPEDVPSIFIAFKNVLTSFGTLSVSSLIATMAEEINRIMSRGAWISPSICITWPLDCLMCIFGSCTNTCVRMLTSYAVVLHCFVGGHFIDSAKSSFKILSRHYKGGFVTEITSRALLNLAAYIFSFCIALIAWTWIDSEFDAGSLPSSDSHIWILYMLGILFTLHYPVVGFYLMILTNRFLTDFERKSMNESIMNGTEVQSTNHEWIPPLAAAFIACISMMLFTFLSNIFLDTMTTLFLCFAISKDNDVDLDGKEEFGDLVKDMPDLIENRTHDDSFDGEDVENQEVDQQQGGDPGVTIIAYETNPVQ